MVIRIETDKEDTFKEREALMVHSNNEQAT